VSFIELDVPRDTISDRLSFGNNKIKRAILYLSEEIPVSKDDYVDSSTEHMNTKSWMKHEQIINTLTAKLILVLNLTNLIYYLLYYNTLLFI